MKNKPYVVCISAWVAGGKTTAVNELLARLPDSKAIFFDNYNNITWKSFPRENYYQWSVNGNDYNDWNLEPIICDIEKALNEEIEYIILELPMGNANEAVSKYIDCTVFLDVPVDVLLARCIMRDYCNRPAHKKKLDNPLESLNGWLAEYIAYSRITVFNYINAVKPYADLIVDGNQPAEKIADVILQHINNKRLT